MAAAPQLTHRDTTRDPWPDNARFLAATLIVIMHFADGPIPPNDVVSYIDDLTWPMRVPLYAMIAGYFSSSDSVTYKHAVSLLRNVLFVYITFEVLVTVHRWMLGGDFVFNPATPSFALWFLLSLFFWRILLPYLAKIRYVIAWSTALAVGAGFISAIGPQYTMSRTLGFLPLFLLGWKLRQIGLRRTLDRPWVRYGAIGMIVVWGVAMFLLRDHFPPGMFGMRAGYREGFLLSGTLGRTLLLVGGAATTLSFLALVPRNRIPWMTYLGSGSLYIYLLHPFVLRQANDLGLMSRFDKPYEIVALFIGCIALSVILASKPVRTFFRPLIQPRYTWPFLPDPSRSVKRESPRLDDERSQPDSPPDTKVTARL